MDQPTQPPTTQPGPSAKKGWPLSSILLLGLAAALALLSVLLYTGTVRIGPQTPPPPPATPGKLQTVDVVEALRAQGLTAEPSRVFVPIREFKVPGQGVTVNGAPLLVFIFPDPDAAKAAFAAADPANVLPPTLPGGGGAAPPDEVTLAQGSNVAAALVGGDQDTRDKVTTAIEGLP